MQNEGLVRLNLLFASGLTAFANGIVLINTMPLTILQPWGFRIAQMYQSFA